MHMIVSAPKFRHCVNGGSEKNPPEVQTQDLLNASYNVPPTAGALDLTFNSITYWLLLKFPLTFSSGEAELVLYAVRRVGCMQFFTCGVLSLM